ncbi:MAG: hypothetical protein KC425_19540 [Anaerolineales bacterium]|nr:hypothetical protein [Anaerolineales bacterium]
MQQHDVTAFADLCEVAHSHLLTYLTIRFPQAEAHMQESAVTDSLLNYQTNPNQYDPDKLSLFAYLRMAAAGDMLNALDKEKRRARRLSNIEELAIQQQLPKQETPSDALALDHWLAQHTHLSRQEILAHLDAELSREDRQILLLVLDGVRASEKFAQVLGISHWDDAAQRQEVKRAKDRIFKHLQRFGQRIART